MFTLAWHVQVSEQYLNLQTSCIYLAPAPHNSERDHSNHAGWPRKGSSGSQEKQAQTSITLGDRCGGRDSQTSCTSHGLLNCPYVVRRDMRHVHNGFRVGLRLTVCAPYAWDSRATCDAVGVLSARLPSTGSSSVKFNHSAASDHDYF